VGTSNCSNAVPAGGPPVPAPAPKSVHAVQAILRSQLSEIPCGTNVHIERLLGLPERVVPQHRLDGRRKRTRPGADRQSCAARGVVENRSTDRCRLVRRPPQLWLCDDVASGQGGILAMFGWRVNRRSNTHIALIEQIKGTCQSGF
jgi:hypothetical protein